MEPPINRERPAAGASAGATGSPGAASDADVIEMGGHPPRWPWGSTRGSRISMTVPALVAGLLLGYVGGHLQARTVAATPGRKAVAHATVLPVGDTAISATGNRCAVQLGHTLQLGIELVNQSDRTLALRQVKPVLPLGGLHPVATQWGTCGFLPVLGAGQAESLAPGATGWITITFDVMVFCPQPLPVAFRVSYLQGGSVVTAEFDSFPDLGQVSYSNCRASPVGQ